MDKIKQNDGATETPRSIIKPATEKPQGGRTEYSRPVPKPGKKKGNTEKK